MNSTMRLDDPTTWSDPQMHPDWGDSGTWTKMLRDCCIAILEAVSQSSTHLVIIPEDGLVYCEIAVAGTKLGELFCIERLQDKVVRFGFFTEAAIGELELYASHKEEVCRIVTRVIEGNDLAELEAEFGSC